MFYKVEQEDRLLLSKSKINNNKKNSDVVNRSASSI